MSSRFAKISEKENKKGFPFLQTVKKPTLGMHARDCFPFICNPQRWLSAPRAETFRCLCQMQADEGLMRHSVHAACPAMNDNAEL